MWIHYLGDVVFSLRAISIMGLVISGLILFVLGCVYDFDIDELFLSPEPKTRKTVKTLAIVVLVCALILVLVPSEQTILLMTK